MKTIVLCPICNKEKSIDAANKKAAEKRPCRSCSQKQVNVVRNSPSRKGIHCGLGYIGSDGYKNISIGCRQYKKEHRLIVENNIGRELSSSEIVHHINLDKLDNRLENLYLCLNESQHQRVHSSLDDVVKQLINQGLIVFSDGEYSMAVGKVRELLEQPEEANQQPSPNSGEGSETR